MQSYLLQTILTSCNDLPICALLKMGKTIRARLPIHHDNVNLVLFKEDDILLQVSQRQCAGLRGPCI